MLLQNETEPVLQSLRFSAGGLTEAEAQKRLLQKGKQQKIKRPWVADARLLLQQFKSPLVLLLVFAVVLSAALGEYSDMGIVLVVLLITGILGFVQERNAGRAVQALQAMVQCKATVKRDGNVKDVLLDDVVEGDLVLLNAGDMIPADAVIVDANDLHVNESVLTGESFAVEKFCAVCFLFFQMKPEKVV
jgi:Mg2+-importing ATPase